MIRTERATVAHAPGLGELLALASRGCFCRWWHFAEDDLSWQGRCNLEPERNRAELERALAEQSPEASGVVALEDERVVGWLKLCPDAQMSKLRGRRLYRSLDCFDGDRQRTWIIGCLAVHPERRREGIAEALVRAAVALAPSLGAEVLEAMPRRSREPLRDDELWMGPVEVFERQGFTVVAGPDAYPVLRRRL